MVTHSSLSKRDKDSVWHPFTPQLNGPANVEITRGNGTLLYDADGNAYIDAISSWWVNLHGHCHPYITQAITDQLTKLEHVLFSGYTHLPAVHLAERLRELLPFTGKVFYSDDGSTAVEVALKMCFQYWHNKGEVRTKIIAFENAYHGDTFGSMSVGARNVFSRAFESMLFDVVHIPLPAAGNTEESLRQLQAHLGNETAAFIYEPLVQGAAGMITYSHSVLDEMIAECRRKNVPVIADEVMTGFGRTGKMFASDYCLNKPDIICLSKGITGGFFPLGATLCTDEIHSAYLTSDKTKTFFHGHSYTANPVVCAAAVANLEWFIQGNVVHRIGEISIALKAIGTELENHRSVAEVRHIGAILAFELKSSAGTGYLNSAGETAADFFRNEGVILRPLGNVVYFIPPFCITDDELLKLKKVMLRFLDSLTPEK